MKLRGMIALIIALLLPLCVLGEQSAPEAQIPSLTSISFKNAKINEAFTPGIFEYTLTLEDPTTPPTLKDFNVDGRGNLFITYIFDEANHQKGICATLEYENGSAIYNFMYSNAVEYIKNSNNYLKEVTGYCAELYPEISKSRSRYKVYVPKDMTVLRMTGVTDDIGAYCDLPGEIIVSAEQEPSILVTVTASNGESRVYTLGIKRSGLTEEQVLSRMAKGGFSYADEDVFFRKPVFRIAVISCAAGIVFIALLLYLLRRVVIKPEDDEETEFFETV